MTTVTLKDNYTRKVGGEKYIYDAQYSTGARVIWSARVYKDGDLKGSPGGILSDNALEGEALRQSIVTLVEICIETLQGIEE